MYQSHIDSADKALVHLAFHCCLKDGVLQEEELDSISETFAAKGLNKNLDLKDEMQQYLSYHKSLGDENVFLQFLINTVNSKNKLALFAFCTEIIYRDGVLANSEEGLLNKIAGLLHLSDHENITVQKLISELSDVENRSAF